MSEIFNGSAASMHTNSGLFSDLHRKISENLNDCMPLLVTTESLKESIVIVPREAVDDPFPESDSIDPYNSLQAFRTLRKRLAHERRCRFISSSVCAELLVPADTEKQPTEIIIVRGSGTSTNDEYHVTFSDVPEDETFSL